MHPFSGHVLDHEGDNFIESYIVHSLNLGQVEPGYLGKDCYILEFSEVMFLMFRWKIDFCYN